MSTTTNFYGPKQEPGFVWDSGSVASGAVINSDVFHLHKITALQLIVDNTAASVFRDLTMVTYADDGTTQLDSVLLRKCAFGTAPTGSSYAPGAIRGQVGSVAATTDDGSSVIYDATSAANTAQDVTLRVEGARAVHAKFRATGGTATLTPYEVEDDGTTPGSFSTLTPGAASAGMDFVMGLRLPYNSVVSNNLWSSLPVPKSLRFVVSAAGVGATTRLIVKSYGPTPGTFSHPCVLPTRAKFTLGAAGSAAARLTVIGR